MKPSVSLAPPQADLVEVERAQRPRIGGAAELPLRVDDAPFALGAPLGEMLVETVADDLVHEREPVEGVARVRDAAAGVGFRAVLLDVASRQRGAPEHHRRRDAETAHLLEVLAHHHRRLDEQARHADRVRAVLVRRLEDRADRLLDAEVDDPVPVVREDDVDEVLADVVHVAAHRGEHDRALRVPFDALHVRLEVAYRRLHRLGGLQHEGKLHLAGAEEVSDRLHAVQKDVVDDVERLVRPHRQGEVVLEPEPVAVDDALREPLLDLLGARLPGAGAGRAALEERDEGLQRIIALPPPVEDEVLGDARLLLRDLVERRDLGEVHDGAGEAASRRVLEEHRIEHVPRRRIEAERNVREAEDDLALRHLLADPLDRVQRRETESAVVVVPGADREGQRIEEKIGLWKPVAAAGEIAQPARDRDLAVGLLRHALLVDGEGDDGGSGSGGRASRRLAAGPSPSSKLIELMIGLPP